MFDADGKLIHNELELAARADAAQKLAICALAMIQRLALERSVDLDLARYADELEGFAPAPASGAGAAVEYRGRMIAADLIRQVSSTGPSNGPRRS